MGYWQKESEFGKKVGCFKASLGSLGLMSFYPWYDIAYLVFFKSSQLSSQVFAKHGFASVLIVAQLTDIHRYRM